MEEKTKTIFVDHVGRTVVGQVEESNEKTLTVVNPAIVDVRINPNGGQLNVQLIPYLFRQFLTEDSDKLTWVFEKSQIVQCENAQLNEQFTSQYEQLFNQPLPPQGEQPSGGDSTVQLFDE